MNKLFATLILSTVTAVASTAAVAQSADPIVANREAIKSASKAYDEKAAAAKKTYKEAVAAAKKTYDGEISAAKAEKKAATEQANKELSGAVKKNPISDGSNSIKAK